MLDVARLRADTPGCAEVAHLNNAGAALMPAPVLAALREAIDLEARIGGYEAERERWGEGEAVRASLARLVGGAGPDEIALLESASRAWQAIFGAVDLRAGDRVLVGRAEYASNVMPLLQAVRRRGISLEVVPDDGDGAMDVEAMSRMLDERVRLVSAVHVPTNGGLVNPVAAVGEALLGTEALYVVDASQSAGQIPLDVVEIGCHALFAPGRKFLRGPRGTAFLWVRDDWAERLEPAVVDGHGASWTGELDYVLSPGAVRFETWEAARAGQLALGAAVDYALELGVEATWARIRELSERLRGELRAIPGVTIHDRGRELCGIVTFSVDGVAAAEVRERLRREGVNVWVNEAVAAQLSMAPRGLASYVRASVHAYNDDGDLSRLLAGIRALA